MTTLPANPIRGLIGLVAIICMIIGAGILWGPGAALFAGGLYMTLDAATDEAIERFTKTKRGRELPSFNST